MDYLRIVIWSVLLTVLVSVHASPYGGHHQSYVKLKLKRVLPPARLLHKSVLKLKPLAQANPKLRRLYHDVKFLAHLATPHPHRFHRRRPRKQPPRSQHHHHHYIHPQAALYNPLVPAPLYFPLAPVYYPPAPQFYPQPAPMYYPPGTQYGYLPHPSPVYPPDGHHYHHHRPPHTDYDGRPPAESEDDEDDEDDGPPPRKRRRRPQRPSPPPPLHVNVHIHERRYQNGHKDCCPRTGEPDTPAQECQPCHDHEPDPDHEFDHDPEYEPGHKPDHEPGHKPDHEPGHKPDHEPGHKPDQNPGHKPDHEPGHKPDHEPGHKPDQDPAYDSCLPRGDDDRTCNAPLQCCSLAYPREGADPIGCSRCPDGCDCIPPPPPPPPPTSSLVDGQDEVPSLSNASPQTGGSVPREDPEGPQCCQSNDPACHPPACSTHTVIHVPTRVHTVHHHHVKKVKVPVYIHHKHTHHHVEVKHKAPKVTYHRHHEEEDEQGLGGDEYEEDLHSAWHSRQDGPHDEEGADDHDDDDDDQHFNDSLENGNDFDDHEAPSRGRHRY